MTSLEDTVEQFLWRAWTTLGVAGSVPPLGDLLIDPEGLLIMTAVTSGDARLQDEVVDWASRYFSHISKARLRNASQRLSGEERVRLSNLAGRVNAVSSARWPATQWKGPRPRLSGKSRLPSPLDAGALAHLRYRAIFGTTSRAEILLYLDRMDGWASAASIASAVGYAKRIVATTLDELALAQVVATEESGNRTDYRLRSKRQLDALAGAIAEERLDWVGWTRVLATCARTASSKPNVARVELAKTLAETHLEKVTAPDVDSIAATFRRRSTLR